MPMSSRSPGVIQRAYELARSGRCRGVQEIRTALKREGFEAVDMQLEGRMLRMELSKLCREPRATPLAS